jgi:hypothetical protein
MIGEHLRRQFAYIDCQAPDSNDEKLPKANAIGSFSNGAYRDRTCDLLVANQALSQLS